MGVTSYLRKGNRVRTVKLRGVYSECLIIPMTYIQGVRRTEGADCMEVLGIVNTNHQLNKFNLLQVEKLNGETIRTSISTTNSQTLKTLMECLLKKI
jgi:hypothetical protein